MTRRFRRGVVLACTLALTWVGDARATTLAVPQKNQEQDQWCWAAVSQAVLEYYGVSQTQTAIAQYGTEGANIWNWLYGSSTSPTRRGVDLILRQFANQATTPLVRSLTSKEVSLEIGASRPFFVRWAWDAGGGHHVVVRGVNKTTLYLMDPWYGPTINSYSWVVRGGGHTWTDSLKMNAAPKRRVASNAAAPLLLPILLQGE